MSATAKMWRYSLPSIQGQGWAVVIIDSTGFFSTVSDWGNYAYWWSGHGREDFREFLLTADADYVQRKLKPQEEYKPEATLKAIRTHILRLRRSEELEREEARDEWNLLDRQHLYTEICFSEWMHDTGLPGPWEFAVSGPSGDILAFCANVMPRLKEAIRAELALERAT